MSAEKLRTALDRIQDNPFDETAWTDVEDVVTGDSTPEVERELELARMRHEQIKNWGAVARLLELEIALDDDPAIASAKQHELGRIYHEELFSEERALEHFRGVLSFRPDDQRVQQAIDEIEQSRESAEDAIDAALVEALDTEDDRVRAPKLLEAAELTFRYASGSGERMEQAQEYLSKVLELDREPRALSLAAAFYSSQSRWEALADVLEAKLESSDPKAERIAAAVQLAAITRTKLDDEKRALAAHGALLDLDPTNRKALSYLVEHYSEGEEWEHLAALYEDQVESGALPEEEQLGACVQLGMLYWKRLERPEQAERWFERVRKADPTHVGMLNFFREHLAERGDLGRLMTVLTEAQRATDDADAKKALASEIAELAEGQENARRAIEQYKTILRNDPDDEEARDKLKQLYLETESYNALVELLRQELSRLDEDDVEGRVALLWEIAGVYRDKMESDTALLTVLTQITQLDESDIAAVRGLRDVYESLGRWRDLLSTEQRLAELTDNPTEKENLLRNVARRWLEQFSNVQNAMSAYEALLAFKPNDVEAREKLLDLYKKRRAWDKLYDLYEAQLEELEGEVRVERMLEMAKLAAERLGKGEEAIRLLKEVLVFDPHAEGVLDQLERQGERQKDYDTVAYVLERRIEQAEDDKAKLSLLQKLGVLYSDKIGDTERSNEAWRRVLELSPGHKRALRVLRQAYVDARDWDGLEDLYQSQDDFEGLADFLSTTADRIEGDEDKIELSFRAARVYTDQIGAPERAARSYERVLSIDESNVEAAKALLPIYEEDEKWTRLPNLYEVLLEATDDVDAKIEILRKVAEITGGPLANKHAALEYARQAYELRPDEHGLEELEEWSRGAGEWDAFIEVVKQRLSSEDVSAERKRELREKLAQIYATEVERVDEAVAMYRQLLEEDPSDEDTSRAFEELLRASDRRDDLRWLFELRVEQTTGEAKCVALEDWATVEEDVFGEPEKAIELLRRIVAEDSGRTSALSTLTRLLLSAERYSDAAEVMELHRDAQSGPERVELEVGLAELFLERLDRPEDAFAASVRALAEDPSHEPAIAMLERLMEEPRTRSKAADKLERIYAETGDADKQVTALEAMLEHVEDKDSRTELCKRLADVHENERGQSGAAFEVVLSALVDAPERTELWDRAAELGAAAGRPTDLAEAYRKHITDDEGEPSDLDPELMVELSERAAVLHEEQLGDAEGAVPYLERILELDPTNERAFERLKAIFNAVERWDDLERLYDRTIEATESDGAKVELLHQAAVVAEDMIGNDEDAIGHYERIVAIDPLHEPASEALERLYARKERYADLAKLLERKLETATEDEAPEIQLRLAELYLHQLKTHDRVMEHLGGLLRVHHGDLDARALAEECLQFDQLRQPAAALLDTVYEAVDDPRDLVRVLQVRLEGAEDGEARRELLHRIGTLQDERLKDDDGAFQTLCQLLPLEPDDGAIRERLLEVGRRLGENEKMADTLLATAERATIPSTRGELLMEAAGLLRDKLDEPERAEQVYRRVLEIDADDPDLVVPAARQLAEIYEEIGEHEKLGETLRTQVRLVSDPEEKRTLYARMANLYEDLLEDDERAIEAWKARVEDDPSDLEALRSLERLYERSEKWAELVDTLRQLEGVALDGDERKRCMIKAAEVLARELEDTEEAISAWRAVLDDFGPERDVLEALSKLYRKAERWEELAEVLDMWLTLADDTDERVRLYAALGDVRREHLADPHGALAAYRDVLSLERSHAEARKALEILLEHDEPDIQREAAEILGPIYDDEGEAESLLKVLDIEVEATFDPGERLRTLERALQTAEDILESPSRAFDYARRGVREAIGEPGLRGWIDLVERLGEQTRRYEELLSLYESVTADMLDAEVQQRTRLRAGEIARDELGDDHRAIEHYRAALDNQPNDERAMVALEELYEKTEKNESLLEILRLRADTADSDDDRIELFFRVAALQAGPLERPDDAIVTYEDILNLELDSRAIEALEKLYTEAERFDDLVRLYERQLDDAEGDEAAAIRVKIAKTCHGHLQDDPRALDELGEALAQDPDHRPAIAQLEKLLEEAEEPEQRGRVAEMLEPVYLASHDWDKLEAALKARLETAFDPVAKGELLSRLATLYEEQLENYRAALDMTAERLRDDPHDEDVWAEIERLGRVVGEGPDGEGEETTAEQRVADIFASALEEVAADDPQTARLAQRAGELYAQAEKYEKGLEWLRRAYAFDPESTELFEAIDRILDALDRKEERVEHYRAALDHTFDDDVRGGHLHVIAELQRELGRDADAVATYNEILDVHERDERAYDALTELYDKGGRTEELAELYERRADLAETPKEGAPHRLALARLLAADEMTRDRAIDQLDTILQDLPDHREAIAVLEELLEDEERKQRIIDILRPIYQQQGHWEGLIHLNEERLALLDLPMDKVDVLTETASLWEHQGEDEEKAFSVMRMAFLLAPDHEETRAEVDRLAEELDAWDEAAVTYRQAAEEVEDEFVKRQLYDALARISDEELNDPRAALEALGKLSALEPTDPEPLERMDILCMLLSDWDTLVGVLQQKADNATDDDRAAILRRLGAIKRDMLDNPDGAVEVFEQALDVAPTSGETLDALIELYRSRDAQRLVELLEQRIEHADLDEPEQKRAFILEAADVYRDKLERSEDAIRVLQLALDEDPTDLEVLRRLEALFEAQQMYDDLLDNLKAQAGIADEVAKRLTLRNRIGDLYLQQLDNPFDALAQYRTVLEEADLGQSSEEAEDPAAHAVAQAHAIGESHEELRFDVSTLLEPVLQRIGDFAALVDVMELRFAAQTDPDDRAETLQGIALIQEEQLDRPADAKRTLLRALTETPDSEDLHGEIERLCELNGEWADYADTLAERADATFDAVVQTDLWWRLGRISEERLDDRERAIDAYSRAADQADDPGELLEALDRLYSAAERWEDLARILERRIDREVEGEASADLLHRLAKLQIERFEQLEIGLGTLRRAADLAPEHEGVREQLEGLTDEESLFEEVAEALDTMYRIAGDNEARAKLRNKRISYAPNAAERVRLRLDLAQMLEDETGDTGAAQDVVEQAFHDDPSEPELLAQIERLAAMNDEGDGEAWRKAADAIGEATSRALDREERGEGEGTVAPELARELYLRTAAWYRSHCEDDEAAEKRLSAALEQDPKSGEALTKLEEIQRAPGRQADLIATLRRLAELSDTGELMLERSSAELRKEAKLLAEEQLEDGDLAEAIVREMLGADDTDVWALRELSAVCARKEADEELYDLLQRRIELMPEPEELRELRHQAAEVAERLEKHEEAVDLHEQSFEDDPRDEVAGAGLRRLYEKLERYDDMLRFTERLIDLTDDETERADLRLECARICIEVLDTPSEGIDNLNAVLEEVPTHGGAVELLAKMLEKEGRDDELAELLQKQIELAHEGDEQEKELGYRVKLAELYESRLNDPERAIDGYRAVLETDPGFRPALEALARLHEQQDEKKEAAETYEKLLDSAEPEERGRLARKTRDLYTTIDDDDAAVAVLERVLEDAGSLEGEEVSEIRDGLRTLYQKHERWDDYARLLETEADEAEGDDEKVVAHRKVAEIRSEKLEDHAGAAEALEKALALKDDDRDIMLALCDEYTASGRGKAAIEVLQKVVESYGGRRSKELADIHKRIASAYVAEGDTESALKELESARKMDPGSIGVLYELGSLSLKLAEEEDEASREEHLKRAGNAFRSLLLQRLDEDAPLTKADIFYNLALVSHLGGKPRDAKKNAERAVSNDKDHEKAKALLEEIG